MRVHQYIERRTGRVCNETLIADNWVRLLYGSGRENAPRVFKAMTSARFTRWLAFMHFDLPLRQKPGKIKKIIDELKIDTHECAKPVETLKTVREVFERQIKYWHCRPMPDDPCIVVAPADARVLVGSLQQCRNFFIKEKFFSYEELLGPGKESWLKAFEGGDFAIFRLTPDKYHYNHAPVSGRVVDFYSIEGGFHSCNPAAVVAEVTPYSKNKRVVTVIDTDVPGGTGVGLVAMVEIVALMIGEIVQAYSLRQYEKPGAVAPGMFVRKGQPKSLFRPGSSVDVLFFQKTRMIFDWDLVANTNRMEVRSRFSKGFQHPLVETDVQVRSSIGRGVPAARRRVMDCFVKVSC